MAPKDRFKQVAVHRIWTTRFGRGRLGGRSIDYLTFYLNAFGRMLRLACRGDVIIATTDPPLLSVLAWPAAAVRGAVQINWLHDLFPEVALALGVMRQGLGSRLLGHLRNLSLRHAARNVVIGDLMAAHLLAQSIPADRLTVIHNWSDGDVILPLAPAENPLRAEWDLAASFVVGYSGNLGRAHDFATILGAADMLRDDRKIRFLFTGGGHYLDYIEAETQRRALPNVTIKPFQPAWRLKETLALPDLHLVSLLPALEGLIVPSKFYGIAAAGRPTIFLGNPSGEVAGLLRNAFCGATVAVGNVQALANCISALRRSPAMRELWSGNARTLFMQRFDRSLAVARWSDTIADALDAAAGSEPHTVADRETARSHTAGEAPARLIGRWKSTTASNRVR